LSYRYRYFPTDELENVPERPEIAAARAQAQTVSQPLQIGEETGLPFIGYTYTRLYVPSFYTVWWVITDVIAATGSAVKVVYRRYCLWIPVDNTSGLSQGVWSSGKGVGVTLRPGDNA
jgi:hypothetical protein